MQQMIRHGTHKLKSKLKVYIALGMKHVSCYITCYFIYIASLLIEIIINLYQCMRIFLYIE